MIYSENKKYRQVLHEKLIENVTDAFSHWLRFGYHSALLRALERD